MKTLEQQEALEAIVAHYGLPVLLSEIDGILEKIRQGVLSVPLDKDPEKAALNLYAERMKLEGAVAVKNALVTKINDVKTRKREGSNG